MSIYKFYHKVIGSTFFVVGLIGWLNIRLSLDIDMPSEPESSRPQAETDPRFPSGPWVGFWIQRGMGKQKMRLALWFAGGKIGGSGADIVGRFSFAGTYDLKTGKCLMVKQYDHSHSVQYDGANEGDGMWLWGVWRMRIDQGGFHIWPEGEEDPTESRSKATRKRPVAKRRKLALSSTT